MHDKQELRRGMQFRSHSRRQVHEQRIALEGRVSLTQNNSHPLRVSRLALFFCGGACWITMVAGCEPAASVPELARHDDVTNLANTHRWTRRQRETLEKLERSEQLRQLVLLRQERLKRLEVKLVPVPVPVPMPVLVSVPVPVQVPKPGPGLGPGPGRPWFLPSIVMTIEHRRPLLRR